MDEASIIPKISIPMHFSITKDKDYGCPYHHATKFLPIILTVNAGALVFDPATVTISKGDSVTWVNNAGFPHNIVFDEDAVPSGVDASKLGQEDYLNAPGETVTNKFDVAGEYNYYCEPHQGAGMQGKIVVQ